MMQASPFKNVRACVFDFDGTLVDTMGGFADLASKLMEKYHGMNQAYARRQYMLTSGIPFFQQLEMIHPGAPNNAACADEFETLKLKEFFDVAPDPDTIRGLSMLRKSGIYLAVSSNNFQHNLDAYMKIHNLPVDMALGFDGLGMEKGRPHFQKVQNKFGVSSSQLLYCGDSIQDGEKAASCGVRFVGKVGTFQPEEFKKHFQDIMTIDSIYDLAMHLTNGPYN